MIWLIVVLCIIGYCLAGAFIHKILCKVDQGFDDSSTSTNTDDYGIVVLAFVVWPAPAVGLIVYGLYHGIIALGILLCLLPSRIKFLFSKIKSFDWRRQYREGKKSTTTDPPQWEVDKI